LARATAAGIRIWVPSTERDLFADVSTHWQTRTISDYYDLRQDRFSLLGAARPPGRLCGTRARAGASTCCTSCWRSPTAAKRIKPGALIVTHTPDPAFLDVTDMIRLNDVLHTDHPEGLSPPSDTAVVEQMTYRARVVCAACPELLVDTDGWRLPGQTGPGGVRRGRARPGRARAVLRREDGVRADRPGHLGDGRGGVGGPSRGARAHGAAT
jgi:hypothetical protein